jgi:ferredoxin
MLAQITFVLALLLGGSAVVRGFSRIYRAISLGHDRVASDGNEWARWRNVGLIALGQRKMFKKWIPAVLHGFIYVAFLFTQIELIEIVIDGLLGQHRFFAPYLGVLYPIIISTIEILSLLALVATIAFLWRRNVKKIARFDKPELKGWPALDANIILGLEIVLVFAIFCMNGADKALQSIHHPDYHATGFFALSSWIGPAVFKNFSPVFLIITERFGWWLHFAVVMAFAVYLAYSKHLHVFLAFFNTYFATNKANGEMTNMPEIMDEVKGMLGIAPPPPAADTMPVFGAADVTEMSWQTLLGAFSCTECGRCTDACPANQTGKKLSPRKIMMDIRDRAEDVIKKIDAGDKKYIGAEHDKAKPLCKDNFSDGKNLFDLISREEIHACTTCNACVEACPILINPLEPIMQLRRHEILMQSAGPGDWLPMFNALENTGAVWQMPVDREHWTKILEENN